MTNMVLYGAVWCADCKRSRAFLDARSITYDYVDIDTEPGAAEKVAEINDGYNSIPTIVFPDGRILVEPSDKLLAESISSVAR
jgi:mycoredoxin